MAKNQNKKKRMARALTAVAAVSAMIATPLLAMLVVQNLSEDGIQVEAQSITKVAGLDTALAAEYIEVITGTNTVSEQGESNEAVAIREEKINFACLAGDRTYYTDIMHVVNPSSNDWNVSIKPGSTNPASNPTFEHTFVDAADDGTDIDVWVMMSTADSGADEQGNLSAGVGGTPFPYEDTDGWNTTEYMHIEINDSIDAGISGPSDTLSITGMAESNDSYAPFTNVIPAGESRQLAMVVDCGNNTFDEITTGTNPTADAYGSFRFTIESMTR